MINCDYILFHNRQRQKFVLMIIISPIISYKSDENVMVEKKDAIPEAVEKN